MAKRASIAADQTDEEPQAGLDLGRLGGILGFHLRMANAAIHRDFAATLGELALTQKQLAVLELIERNPGVSQIDLANTLGTDRATMMALVDRLDLRGLIERRISLVDKRRQELRLTTAGEIVRREAFGLVDSHEQRFLSRFTPAERERLVDALKRIYRD
jgi:DNA-binding MarR family transcriptional regulator